MEGQTLLPHVEHCWANQGLGMTSCGLVASLCKFENSWEFHVRDEIESWDDLSEY